MANAAAFGLVLLAGHSAQAITFNVGTIPVDGTTLMFAGDTTIDGYDVYNFTLPFDIGGTGSAWLHIETGNANYDTQIHLYPDFNLGGTKLTYNDDSDNTFGPCEIGTGGGLTNYLCSSIGSGSDPLARTYGQYVYELPAGNYSLEVEGYSYNEGTYELQITADIPEPGTLAIFGVGLWRLAKMRRRKTM